MSSSSTGVTRVIIVGAAGRMGRTLTRLVVDDPSLQLVGAATLPGDALIGQDAGTVAGTRAAGVALSSFEPDPHRDISGMCDVLIDFTTPEGAVAWARWCARAGAAMVCGSTGLAPADLDVLREAARAVPVLWSPNMSVGVNLLLRLVREAARSLDADWDIEIAESHHRLKADAPSGTAKALLDAACEGRGVAASDVAIHGREGLLGVRKRGEIGVHALRLGGVVGEHDVHFATPFEHITLSHRAESRDVFAAGALRAAKWLAGKPAGLYAMRDVLGG